MYDDFYPTIDATHRIRNDYIRIRLLPEFIPQVAPSQESPPSVLSFLDLATSQKIIADSEYLCLFHSEYSEFNP